MTFSYSSYTQVLSVENDSEQLLKACFSCEIEDLQIPVSVSKIAKFLGVPIQAWDLEYLGKEVLGVLLSQDGPILIDRFCGTEYSNFIIAHELAHKLYEDYSILQKKAICESSATLSMTQFSKNKKEDRWGWREVRANHFADAIRMPLPLFVEYAEKYQRIDSHAVYEIAEYFNVSKKAAFIRLQQIVQPLNYYHLASSLKVDWESLDKNPSMVDGNDIFKKNTNSPSALLCNRTKVVSLSNLVQELDQISSNQSIKIIVGTDSDLVYDNIELLFNEKRENNKLRIVFLSDNAEQCYIASRLNIINDVLFIQNDLQIEIDYSQLLYNYRDSLIFFKTSSEIEEDLRIILPSDEELRTFSYVPAYKIYPTKNTSQISLPIEMKIPDIAIASKYIEEQKASGKHVVLVIGCFDLVNSAHVSFIEEAKNVNSGENNILVVGIEDDNRVKEFKSSQDIPRPRYKLLERMAIIRALKPVDFVFAISGSISLNPIEIDKFYSNLYKKLNPDFVAISDMENVITNRRMDQIRKANITLHICKYHDHTSTTNNISRIIMDWEKKSMIRNETNYRTYERAIAKPTLKHGFNIKSDGSKQLELPF